MVVWTKPEAFLPLEFLLISPLRLIHDRIFNPMVINLQNHSFCEAKPIMNKVPQQLNHHSQQNFSDLLLVILDGQWDLMLPVGAQ